MYKLRWSKQALKDKVDVERARLMPKLSKILGVVERDPFEPTQGHCFEKLEGALKDHYSRHVNYYNRFIYTVRANTEDAKDKDSNQYEGIVCILRTWGHDYKKK